MSKSTSELKKQFEQAEADAQKLMAEKDAAVDKARSKYADRLRKANDKAAEAQKRWLDAEAADALRDRPDGEAVASALGLSLD
jgi:hypothetical protein